MSSSLAELLVLVATALNTGYLLFIATVLQKVMDAMDEAAFRAFVPLLVRTAIHDVYTVVAGTITLAATVPYLLAFGVSSGWFVAGLAVFLLSSVAGKLLNLPAYARIEALDVGDAAPLRAQRDRLRTANRVRASLCVASVALMVVQFV